jgi:hypothetical protein
MKIKTSVMTCGLAVRLLVQPSVAGQNEDGLVAANRGNHTTGLQILPPFAVHGNADAEFNLVVVRYVGQGLPQDTFETLKWHRLATDQDNCDEP